MSVSRWEWPTNLSFTNTSKSACFNCNLKLFGLKYLMSAFTTDSDRLAFCKCRFSKSRYWRSFGLLQPRIKLKTNASRGATYGDLFILNDMRQIYLQKAI